MSSCQNEKPVVLVTAIGTMAATTIVKELHKDGRYHIIGTDIFPHNEIATSLDVDEFYNAPSSVNDEAQFLDFIFDLCMKHHVDYYFATIDEEVANISRNRERFNIIGTKLCIPDNDTIEICHNKDTFVKWCEKMFPEISIHCITTQFEAQNANYPLFLKPAIGRASMSCKIINSYEDLLACGNSLNFDGSIILQDYIEGDIITVDVIRNATTNQFEAIPRLELIRNANGCGIAVELFDDASLVELCRQIAVALNLNGVINIEFFKTLEGYKIIEANPRFSAGAVYSCMAGAELVYDAIRIANKEHLDQHNIRFNTHFAKRYDAYETY